VCLGRAIAVMSWDATQSVAGEFVARVLAAAVYTLVFQWEGYGSVPSSGPSALFSPAKRRRSESSQASVRLVIMAGGFCHHKPVVCSLAESLVSLDPGESAIAHCNNVCLQVNPARDCQRNSHTSTISTDLQS